MASLPRPVLRVFRALPENVRQRAVRAASPSYTLGAQARITRDDGRILLVKAAYRWRWGMPGGLMDAGEGPDEAVIRETLEETGLHIVLLGEPVVLVETGMQRVNFMYNAEPAPGVDPDDLQAQASEILELGWFHLHEMPETIPDMSGEVMLRVKDPADRPSVIVTNAVLDDQPLDET
ncbi:MAG: 8-oxo-dGTP diphosphatase [Verrucomicrobiales bacterium]|jgi:8-oxo-dGTP diphosphatase